MVVFILVCIYFVMVFSIFIVELGGDFVVGVILYVMIIMMGIVVVIGVIVVV